MYKYEVMPNLQKILNKLFNKDRINYEQVIKKVEEIINSGDPQHYKNLRAPLQNLKRVHIGHFVLVFSVDENTKTIKFENFDHHDKIYK
jgi:YafQ family addiction module toxin component